MQRTTIEQTENIKNEHNIILDDKFKEINDLEVKYNDLSKENHRLLEEVEKQNNELRDYQDSLTMKENLIKNTNEQIENLKNENILSSNRTETELKDLKSENDKLTSELEQKNNEIKEQNELQDHKVTNLTEEINRFEKKLILFWLKIQKRSGK